MGMSFTVEGSPTYKIWYECGCRFHNAGIPMPECSECHGTDVVTFLKYTWECNFSNANARMVMECAEMEFDYSGYIKASEVEGILEKADEFLSHAPMNHRLERFAEILKIALDKGKGIGFG